MRDIMGLPEQLVSALMAEVLTEPPEEHLALVHFAQRQRCHLRSTSMLSWLHLSCQVAMRPESHDTMVCQGTHDAACLRHHDHAALRKHLLAIV